MQSFTSLIKFNKPCAIVGAVIFALGWVVCCVMLSWYPGIAFALAFLISGCLKFEIKQKRWKYVNNILWGLALATVAFFLCAEMLNWSDLHEVNLHKVILNYLCIFVVCGVLFFATGKWKASIVAGTFLLVVLANANGFIYQFRGKELCPMDFFSAGTALSVAQQYTFEIKPNMIFGWIAWLLVAVGQITAPKLPGFLKLKARFAALGAAVVFLSTLWIATANVPIKMWGTQGTEKNGYYLNFFLGIRDSFIQKPENYDPETLEAFCEIYTPIDGGSEESRPNIIVIMSESFADFKILGEVCTNQPVTPFIDSLAENTVRGYALSSVYGANTANSEFEFLTGHSMAFLPENSVPYQQHIDGEIYTLAWLLNSYGYRSISTHPYWADGWSRNKIYPMLGFSESTFIDSYPNQNVIRSYISDREMYEFALEKLYSKNGEEPMFLFGITMQNHGGYTYSGENYMQTVWLDGYSRAYPKAEQYFSVMNETDKATEYLLTALENYPEDTIVLFFGDHFPKVETAFYEELHGGTYDTLDEQMLQYKIPFFIWANYDIPEEYVECTSLNLLSNRLLEVAGLEQSSYHSFLSGLEKVIPAMNALGYYSVSKGGFVTYKEAEGEEADWINRYAILQYNDLFDVENRNQRFFEQYIGWNVKMPDLSEFSSEEQ